MPYERLELYHKFARGTTRQTSNAEVRQSAFGESKTPRAYGSPLRAPEQPGAAVNLISADRKCLDVRQLPLDLNVAAPIQPASHGVRCGTCLSGSPHTSAAQCRA